MVVCSQKVKSKKKLGKKEEKEYVEHTKFSGVLGCTEPEQISSSPMGRTERERTMQGVKEKRASASQQKRQK